MPKHHDRRQDDVQWAKEPRPEGVGRWPVSVRQAPSPGLGSAFAPPPSETSHLPITARRHL
jgi:hypothetical protein